MNTDPKDFIKPDLDYRLVHYIEKQAGHGHTLDEIKADLRKVGRKPEEIQKYIEYVEKHKWQISLHSNYMQLILFGIGLFILLITGAAIYYFLK